MGQLHHVAIRRVRRFKLPILRHLGVRLVVECSACDLHEPVDRMMDAVGVAVRHQQDVGAVRPC